jgi:hypothetical protein
LQDARWVATTRARLASLSWFMKCLKEPLARLAILHAKTRVAFFEGRFENVAILPMIGSGVGAPGQDLNENEPRNLARKSESRHLRT